MARRMFMSEFLLVEFMRSFGRAIKGTKVSVGKRDHIRPGEQGEAPGPSRDAGPGRGGFALLEGGGASLR